MKSVQLAPPPWAIQLPSPSAATAVWIAAPPSPVRARGGHLVLDHVASGRVLRLGRLIVVRDQHYLDDAPGEVEPAALQSLCRSVVEVRAAGHQRTQQESMSTRPPISWNTSRPSM